MHKSVEKLISKAQSIMKSSRDQIHDIDHVTRVVGHVERIGMDMNLSEQEIETLKLAAWWHDASRVLTKKSVIWMVLCDDLISAIMLWMYTIRYGLFGSTAGVATRIIWCKNATVGKYVGRIFLSRKSKLLLDILDDADKLDLMNIERMNIIREMIKTSLRFHLLYRFAVSAGLRTKSLHMNTVAAKKYLQHIIKDILHWIKDHTVYMWHVTQFGKTWTDKMIQKLEIWYYTLQYNSSIPTSLI